MRSSGHGCKVPGIPNQRFEEVLEMALVHYEGELGELPLWLAR
jgi:hypothetical protein